MFSSRASRNSISDATVRRMSNSSRILFCPALPILWRTAGFARRYRIAFAMRWVCVASIKRPLTRSSTSSGIPDIADAITGFPAAIASINVIGIPSICPSFAMTLGSTNTSLSPMRRATSCCGSEPGRWMSFSRPRYSIQCCRKRAGTAARSRGARTPSPTIVVSTSMPARLSVRHASMRKPKPRLGVIAPTDKTCGRDFVRANSDDAFA